MYCTFTKFNFWEHICCILLFLLFALQQGGCEVVDKYECPTEWESFGGYCYKFDEKMTKNWHDANSYCQILGGHLVSVSTQEEGVFLTTLISKESDCIFAGFNDLEAEGQWQWNDGHIWDDTVINWDEKPKDINKHQKNCGCIKKTQMQGQGHKLLWQDIECDREHNFICKMPLLKDSINVASFKVARQSSDFGEYVSSFATDHSLETCSQTLSEDVVWWEVYLIDTYLIQAVEITTGNELLKMATVFISDYPKQSLNYMESRSKCGDIESAQSMTTFLLCSSATRGRYFTIESTNDPESQTDSHSLQLCNVAVFGIASMCSLPLGVSTGVVKASQIHATSWSGEDFPHLARLNYRGSWCAGPKDLNAKIKTDFLQYQYITGLSVHEDFMGRGRILSFTLWYGNNTELQPYQEHGKLKVFQTDEDLSYFKIDIATRYIELRIESFEGQLCLRHEFYGCKTKEQDKFCPMTIGHPPMELDQKDNNGTHIMGDIFPCQGHITKVDLFAPATSSLTLGIWDKDNRNQKKIILREKIQIDIVKTGLQSFTLSKKLAVKPEQFLSLSPTFSPFDVFPVAYSFPMDTKLTSPTEAVLTFIAPLNGKLEIGSHIDLQSSNVTHQHFIHALLLAIESDEELHEQAPPCGGNVTSEMVIYPPNYPGNYDDGMTCTWYISAPEGQFVMLDFMDFELDKPGYGESVCRDKLILYTAEGNKRDILQEKIGSHHPLVKTALQTLNMELKTCLKEEVQTPKMFSVKVGFSECAGCGIGLPQCNHDCISDCGFVASPNYPFHYENHMFCTWNITGKTHHFLEVTFHQMEVESGFMNCTNDYVTIVDFNKQGDPVSSRKYCEHWHPPDIVYSSWSKLQIQFFSDGEFTSTGFYATYRSVKFDVEDEVKNDINLEEEKCGSGWSSYQNFCYKLHAMKEGITWYEALEFCQQEEANLASIMGKEESTVLHYLLTNLWDVDQPEVYIGLNDIESEGNFRWSDKRPMIFTAWANFTEKQPNGGDLENCGMINLETLYITYQWHDVPCAQSNVKQFICKKATDLLEPSPVYIGDVFSNVSVTQNKQMFDCENGERIWDIYKCDGNDDCKDKSDENKTLCEKARNDATCGEDYFQCDSGHCIHVSKYCDFEIDCQDGSDEYACVLPSCRKNEFQCANGECIPLSQRCNILKDCEDNSDEENCNSCRMPYTFQCNDGRCLPWKTNCDGFKDCTGCGEEDEVDCFNSALGICEVTSDVTCDINRDEGYGAITVRNDKMEPQSINSGFQQGLTSTFSVDYTGIETVSLMLAVMVKSMSCEQTVTLDCDKVMLNQSHWTSLRGYNRTFGPGNNTEKCQEDSSCSCQVKYKLTDKLDLPIKTLEFYMTDWTDNTQTFSVSPLVCFSDVGQAAGATMTCRDSIRKPSARKCLYEFDEYGYQEGCRDMSHLDECNNLQPDTLNCKKTQLGTDYRGSLSTTVNGQQCQRWDMQTPFGHPYIDPAMFGEVWLSDVHNYCRNPGKLFAVPFCWTINPLHPVRPCDIPYCEKTKDIGPFSCPDEYVKCPGNYCIPIRYVCDGEWQCANGEDEVGCETYECQGMYKCRGMNNCIPLHQVCDGKRHCRDADDESYCGLDCPLGCDCNGHSTICSGLNSTKIPKGISALSRQIDLSQNQLQILEREELDFSFLGNLDLSHNQFKSLLENQFKSCPNLYKLNLQYNKLEILLTNTFDSLHKLKILLLYGNPLLHRIDSLAFNGLTGLPELDLRESSLNYLHDDMFTGLESLNLLILSDNLIIGISKYSFDNLVNLETLKIEGNDIGDTSNEILKNLSSLKYLSSSSYKFCCMAQQVEQENCLPAPDPFSSCKDLIRSPIFQYSVWILGFMALIGNAVMLVWRWSVLVARSHEWFFINFVFSDMLMSFYLLIIASANIAFKGNYIEYAETWPQSVVCKLAGLLASLSSEGCMVFLCAITFDHCIGVLFPFSRLRLSYKKSKILSSFLWVVVFAFCVIPLIPFPYFGKDYNSQSGVCLDLPLRGNTFKGYAYSVVMYLVVSLIAVAIVFIGYTAIYARIQTLKVSTSGNFQRRRQYFAARKLLILVLIEIVCWSLIVGLGLSSLDGGAVSDDIYAWCVLFLVPISSALNPIIYTVSSVDIIQMVTKAMKKDSKPAEVSSTSTTKLGRKDTMKEQEPMISLFSVMDNEDLDTITLGEFVWQSPTVKTVRDVIEKMVKSMNTLHTVGLAHGHINQDTVMLMDEGNLKGKNDLIVYLANIEHSYMTNDEVDLMEDISTMGFLIFDILEILLMNSNKAI